MSKRKRILYLVLGIALISPLLWGLLTGCSFAPSGSPAGDDVAGDASQSDASNGDGGVPTDSANDGSTDGRPLVAVLFGCSVEVQASPDDGVTIDRPKTIVCGAIARSCKAINDRVPGVEILFVSTQENEWKAQVTPLLGVNSISVRCLGDEGTLDATIPNAENPNSAALLNAMSIEILGATFVAPGRWHSLVGAPITLRWLVPNGPSGDNCHSSSSPDIGFHGARPCDSQIGPFQPAPVTGQGLTLQYTVSGADALDSSLMYQGTVQLMADQLPP